jgi:glutamine synthetase
MHVIREYIVASEKVLFEGDGYSDEWHHEAERRGLPNVRTTPLALDAMVTEKAKKLFEENGVYSHSELEARHEIELEKYIKKVQIEARIMGELVTSHILPPSFKYQNTLIENIKGLKEIGLKESTYVNQKQILEKISEHIGKISELVEKMIEARKISNAISDTRTKAIAYNSQVKEPFFDEIRYHADKLELLVDDNEWVLPKYREMLFLR